MLFVLLLLVQLCLAKTHVYKFEASWRWANPDGLHARPIITFNGSFPLPVIEVDKGDRLVVTLTNGLHNTSTSLHFHGMFQNHTNHMDGPPGMNQCPIPPGHHMTYNFTVDQAGTYWYHSHSGGQYGDGMRQMVIVHDWEVEHGEQLAFSISDWYHDESAVLSHKQLTRYNPTGAEPVPKSSLFNDTRDGSGFAVEPNTTYWIHIANVGVMVSQYLFIEDHEFEIVEVDGVYTKPAKAKMVYLAAGQRVSILLHTKADPGQNFCIVQTLDDTMLDVIPEDLELTTVNQLTYNASLPAAKPHKLSYNSTAYQPFDDFHLQPLEAQPLLPEADHVIRLTLHMDNLGDGVNYAFFNNITYTAPKVPSLLTALSAPEDLVLNSRIYGDNTNALVLQANEIVDLVIDNDDNNNHPLHMHGHQYQVIVRSQKYEDEPHHFHYDDYDEFPENPLVRDTVTVNGNGHAVIRFKADNPGLWFFHCHLDFHLEQGLAVMLVEAPDVFREYFKYEDLPEDYLNVCEASNTAVRGNAAGNTANWLDLSGQNTQPLPLPTGFTTKGYLALILCCLAALYGLWEIIQFGLYDIPKDYNARVESEKRVINELAALLEGRKGAKTKAMLDELREIQGKFGAA